jgi:hypothetical protein
MGNAKRPAAAMTSNPSGRLAPAPPSASGTQASGSPASLAVRHNGVFQSVLCALLTVWGSPKSAKIRAAVAATRWSL